MSSIPKALQPWTAELSLIHPDCWPLLGKLLPKLGNILLRPASTAESSQHPPDGFNGVNSKGTLSQLLQTEWGLLEAYSNEFYRRLAMGESQYLKPGYQQHQRPEAFYVLLDRGPDQYGAPFLIQFALLLVLTRRAREVKRQLHVGFIQIPGEWITATPDSLKDDIHPYKNHARVVPEMVAAWKTAIEEQQIENRALWIAIGARETQPKLIDTDKAWEQMLLIDADATVSEKQPLPTFSVLFYPQRQRLHFQLPADSKALHLLRHPFTIQSALVSVPKTSSQHLKWFQLHPITRVCFFYSHPTLVSVRIPKRIQANCKRLKSCKQTVEHQLVGVWQSKNKTAVVQIDNETIYCNDFFRQAEIKIPLSALTGSFVKPQTSEIAPLAYQVRRDRKAVIIIKDGDDQGFALYFKKETGFAFEKAIALGPMHHERLVEQSFFYTDGDKIFYEISLEDSTHEPRKLNCEHRIYGLIQQYNRMDGRYISAKPLMKDTYGNWVDTLRKDYDIQPNDEPIGGNHSFLLVMRGDREIWQLPRNMRTPNIPNLESPMETCLVEEREPIIHAKYQLRNQWIVYQTASRFKAYDLKAKAELMNMELAHYAI